MYPFFGASFVLRTRIYACAHGPVQRYFVVNLYEEEEQDEEEEEVGKNTKKVHNEDGCKVVGHLALHVARLHLLRAPHIPRRPGRSWLTAASLSGRNIFRARRHVRR